MERRHRSRPERIPGRSGHRCRRRRAAFSLLELILSMAILAVVSAIAVPRFAAARARYGADRAAERLVSDLEYASTLARTGSREIQVKFKKGDKPDESYYTFVEVPDPDRPGLEYTVVLRDSPYNVLLIDAPNDLVYRIDGMPKDTGVFVLRAGPNEQRTITVDQLTGTSSVTNP